MADKTHELLDFLVLGHSPEGATGWPHPVTISIPRVAERRCSTSQWGLTSPTSADSSLSSG